MLNKIQEDKNNVSVKHMVEISAFCRAQFGDIDTDNWPWQRVLMDLIAAALRLLLQSNFLELYLLSRTEYAPLTRTLFKRCQ